MSKTRDVRESGQRAPRLVDRRERRRVVQRRELRQRVELALDRVVDHDRLAEARAAVHDPVRDGVDAAGASASDATGVGRVVLLDRRRA